MSAVYSNQGRVQGTDQTHPDSLKAQAYYISFHYHYYYHYYNYNYYIIIIVIIYFISLFKVYLV